MCVCLLWCVYDMMSGELQAVKSSIVRALAHSIVKHLTQHSSSSKGLYFCIKLSRTCKTDSKMPLRSHLTQHSSSSKGLYFCIKLSRTSKTDSKMPLQKPTILIKLFQFFVLFCFDCEKMASYPPVSNRLLCFYRTLSAVATVEAAVTAAVAAAVAAAQQQQLEQYTAAAAHVCRAPYLPPRQAGPAVQAGVFRAPKGHCYTPVISLGMLCRPGIFGTI